MPQPRLIACVLLPFAAGYYLSYLFRSINALIASDLVAELQISAADLGLLTSVYFRVFAAAQLPSGSQQFVAKQQHDRNGSAHEIAAAIAAARAARSR